MGNRNDGIGDLVRGALAGLAATWVMGQVTSYLYEHEDEEAREREDDARGGKTAFGIAAEKGAALAGMELSDRERARAGSAVHWALGAGAGAVYGALRGRVPLADAGAGLVYGGAFFLAVDEVGNTLLGLTPDPRSFPWEAHARGLAGHLVFGLTAEMSLRLLDSIRR
ncbi:MAG: DUF1440 domain-containing protein [Gemmatimonadota bacterium]